jgi:hypothetical protein
LADDAVLHQQCFGAIAGVELDGEVDQLEGGDAAEADDAEQNQRLT